MSELSESERTVLRDAWLDSNETMWAVLFPAVERIVAARVAEALASVAGLADEWAETVSAATAKAATETGEGRDHYESLAENFAYFEAALRALAADRAEGES